MFRFFLGALAFLIILATLLFWATSKNQAESSATLTAADAQANTLALKQAQADNGNAVLRQAQLSTSTANAQETATADILSAHNRATFSAATSTQNAAQTLARLQQTQVVLQQTQVAMLQQTQIQFSMQLTADSATENARATATQQNKVESAAGTTTASANILFAQTQSVITTQQRRVDQVRQDEVQQQDTTALLWVWGPPLFFLFIVAMFAWTFWYWEVHKRVRRRDILTPLVSAPQLEPPLPEMLLPEANLIIHPEPITTPDGEVSGWMEEVKEQLRAKDKEDYDNSIA